MSHHPIAAGVTAATALAFGVALMPGTAQAAGSSQGTIKAPAGSTTSVAGAEHSAFRTFTSPASRTVRLQRAATVRPRATSTGTVIYAKIGAQLCTTDTGDGTAANPFCLVQDAVNAATAGDTVEVRGDRSDESVTVSTSNISIVGVGTTAGINASNHASGKPALILNGVSGVTISNMWIATGGHGATAVEIIGSTGVTIDSSYVDEDTAAYSQDAITIDGASSDITVSRTFVDAGEGISGRHGISIEAGASHITLAGDLIKDTGIYATGVSGLNVAGDTIQRDCWSGVDVEGASTGVSLENNLIEDAVSDQADGSAGYPDCMSTLPGLGLWAPDVTVASGSTAGTIADYNDFYVYGTDATAPYAWAGTTYATLPAFRAAVSQGAHDTMDTRQPAVIVLRDPYVSMDAGLVNGSAAIGSASASAPGELSSDFYGSTPYTSRGAIQYLSLDPALGVSLSATQTGAYSFNLVSQITSPDAGLYEFIAWGDGADGSGTPASHTYPKLGTYTITVTLNDQRGDAVTNSITVETAGSDYTPYGPVRVLDTRHGIGTGGSTIPVPAGGMLSLKIAGNGGIPADVTAVALNLTVTDAKSDGYITAYPAGLAMPTTSNVNFLAGQTVADMAVVAVGNGGYIDLHNTGAGTVDLVADASGYFTPAVASGYTSLGPTRFLDTRSGTGGYPYPTVSAAHPVKLKIGGIYGVLTGVTAVALNLTVADPSSSGYVTAYPDGGTAPATSNVDFQAGQVLANAAIVPVGADGSIDLAFTGLGSTRLIADVYGYYSASGPAAYVPIVPTRAFDSRTVPNGALPGGDYYTVPLADSSGGIDEPGISGLITNTTVTDTMSNGYLVVFPDKQPVTVPSTSTLNFLPNQTIANLTFATPGDGDGVVDYYNSSGGSLQLIIDVYGLFMTS